VLTLLEEMADLPFVGMDWLLRGGASRDHAELTSAAATFIWTYLSGQVAARIRAHLALSTPPTGGRHDDHRPGGEAVDPPQRLPVGSGSSPAWMLLDAVHHQIASSSDRRGWWWVHQGMHYWDATGRQILDGVAGWRCVNADRMAGRASSQSDPAAGCADGLPRRSR
jgi:hypothetical protein